MDNSNPKQQSSIDYVNRVCKAMNYISQNLYRDLSLVEIAEAVCFSKYHFHRIFKAIAGENIAAFTRRLRVEMAANRLLTDRHNDITTIAFECGFSSSQNFAKAFRQHFAITPSQFRKSKVGNKYSNRENANWFGTLYNCDTVYMNQLRYDNTKMNVEIREMPTYHVAYVRKMGPYNKKTWETSFAELAMWAEPRGYFSSGVMLGLYWDNPDITSSENCRIDACVSVPHDTVAEGQIAFQTIKGGLYGVCRFKIQEDRCHQAWDDAFSWLVNSGYECLDQPCYELYHNHSEDHPEGEWTYDICIPLKAEN